MPTPPRPEGLPSDATWNEEESTWYVGTHDGETKCYRAGSLMVERAA